MPKHLNAQNDDWFYPAKNAAAITPTGSQPIACFGGTYTAADCNAGTNLGSGGNFTMNGSVIDAPL